MYYNYYINWWIIFEFCWHNFEISFLYYTPLIVFLKINFFNIFISSKITNLSIRILSYFIHYTWNNRCGLGCFRSSKQYYINELLLRNLHVSGLDICICWFLDVQFLPIREENIHNMFRISDRDSVLIFPINI